MQFTCLHVLDLFMIHFCVCIIHQQCEGISGTEWARCRHLSVNHPLFIQDSINGSSTSSSFNEMRKKRKSKKAGLDVLTSLFKMVFRGRGFPCQFITISRTGGYLGLRSGPTASGAIVYIVDHGCI